MPYTCEHTRKLSSGSSYDVFAVNFTEWLDSGETISSVTIALAMIHAGVTAGDSEIPRLRTCIRRAERFVSASSSSAKST